MGADMELVRQFNSELSSIMEGKPPISKAKMAAITRFAVKALKYYKHIVHSVEKFIQKCHNEYKVPALYVLDSIIRQSRHQFGPEKDLFGPRFGKNIKLLFQYIYQCPSEDKPKVVRVLNLWQKNGIYSPDVISPLIDMASTSAKVLSASIQRHKKAKAASSKPGAPEEDGNFETFSGFDDDDLPKSGKKRRKGVQMSQDDEIKVLKAQLEQQRKQQELLQQQLQMQIMQTKQQSLQLQLQQQQMRNKIQEQMISGGGVQAPTADANLNLITQIQELQSQLERDKMELSNLTGNSETAPGFSQPPTSAGDNNNAIDTQSQFLENFQQLIQNAKGMVASKDPRQQVGNEKNTTSPKFNQALLDAFEYDDDHDGGKDQRQQNKDESSDGNEYHHGNNSKYENDIPPPAPSTQHPPHGFNNQATQQKKPLLNWEDEQNNMQIDNDDMQIDNDDDYQPEFHQEDPRIKPDPVDVEEQQRRQREIEKKQRDKKLLPPPVPRAMTVASVTLWVGRLPKGFDAEMIGSHFNEYAKVEHIDHIESRGCAFVTMASRFDADSALKYLKHRRIDNYDVKMNWGKTKILFEYSQFWDDNMGCAFIPWDMVNSLQLPAFLDGCVIDEDTLPPGISMPTPTKDEQENLNESSQDSVVPPPAPPSFLHGLPPGLFPPGVMPPIPPPGFRGQLPPMPPGILPPGMHPGLRFNLNRPPLMPQAPDRTSNQDPRFNANRPPFNQMQPPINQMQAPINQMQAPSNQMQAPSNQMQAPSNQMQAPINQMQAPINQIQPARFGVREATNPIFSLQRGEAIRPPFEPRSEDVRFRPPGFQPAFEGRNNRGFPQIGDLNAHPQQPGLPPVRPILAQQSQPKPDWEEEIKNPSLIPTQAFLVGLQQHVPETTQQTVPQTQPATKEDKEDEEKRSERQDRNYRERSPAREDRDRRNRDGNRDRNDRRDRRERSDRDRDDRRERERNDYRDKNERHDRNRRNRDGVREGRDYREVRDHREGRETKDDRDRRGSDRDERESKRSERDRGASSTGSGGKDRFGRDRDEERQRSSDRSRDRSREKSRDRHRDRDEKKEDRTTEEEEEGVDDMDSQSTHEESPHTEHKTPEHHSSKEDDVDEQKLDDTENEEERDLGMKFEEDDNNVKESEEDVVDKKADNELYDPLQSLSPDTTVVQPDDSPDTTVVQPDESPDTTVVQPDEETASSEKEEDTSQEPTSNDSPIFPLQNESDAIFSGDDNDNDGSDAGTDEPTTTTVDSSEHIEENKEAMITEANEELNTDNDIKSIEMNEED